MQAKFASMLSILDLKKTKESLDVSENKTLRLFFVLLLSEGISGLSLMGWN